MNQQIINLAKDLYKKGFVNEAKTLYQLAQESWGKDPADWWKEEQHQEEKTEPKQDDKEPHFSLICGICGKPMEKADQDGVMDLYQCTTPSCSALLDGTEKAIEIWSENCQGVKDSTPSSDELEDWLKKSSLQKFVRILLKGGFVSEAKQLLKVAREFGPEHYREKQLKIREEKLKKLQPKDKKESDKPNKDMEQQ